MALATVWFVLIAVLWIGFFVLEGFDLGVGILHAVVGRTEPERRAAVNSIGPLWDGNEVWLIVAAAGMFAAFPGWYATAFSGFYLLMVLLLVGLIARGVSFEFRGKSDDTRWRRTWDVAMTGGSVIVAAGLGIALGNMLHGVPIDSSGEYTGSFWDLLQPYALFTGLTVLLLCVTHGATFLSLKLEGEGRRRARRLATAIAPVTGLIVLGFVIWTRTSEGSGFFVNPLEASAILAIFAAAWFAGEGYEGWAFAATTVAIASTIGSIFLDLYPRLMVSSTDSAYSLTVQDTAAGSYALTVMTVVAAVLLPVILAYQAWSYHVFHRRVSTRQFTSTKVPGPVSAPPQ